MQTYHRERSRHVVSSEMMNLFEITGGNPELYIVVP
jgi:hypothetical protein